MDARATSAMHVIKREDKQSVVRNFIAQELDARRTASNPGEGDGRPAIFLVARSPESPVARAIAEMSDQISAAGLSIQAVFAQVNGPASRDAREHGAHTQDQTRILRDARLLDAHEVLVIGHRASWVGDCMRRDPASCDAYERYSTDCTLSLLSARGAFDQLWAGAQATRTTWLTETAGPPASAQAEDELLASTALSTQDDRSVHAPATRH